jgi:hypothetical protein
MRKYITNTQKPTNAEQVAKDVAIDYINKFKEQIASVPEEKDPIDEAKNGNICSGQKEKLESYNAVVSRGVPGQVVEIHGHREKGTVMAKFENKDGSLAHEVVTSAPTPPGEDRDEYYDNFDHMFGARDESFLPANITGATQIQAENNISQPSVNEGENITSDPLINEGENAVSEPTVSETVPDEGQNISSDTTSNQKGYNSNNDNDEPSNDLNLAGSSSVLGKRKLDDSDEQTNKRSKKNDGDDNEGSGPTTSE